MKLTLGIDEAGRGPLLGPMVLAAVAVDTRAAQRLSRAGVTDSKRFTGANAHSERTRLAALILETAAHSEVHVIDVGIIDEWCAEGGLNRLEQDRARGLIERAPRCDRIVADGERLFGPLVEYFPALEARNNGESVHVAVAAASILAKVRREELWATIAARYMHVFDPELVSGGGGYVNPTTKRFLRAYIERHHRIPPEGRRSWPWTFAEDLL